MDYKELNSQDELINQYKSWWSKTTTKINSSEWGGSNAKHYAVTGECFKMLGMERNKEIRRYYMLVKMFLFGI